jgi:hypothetical protein
MNKNIAICYWGMTRSTRYIYKSHHENLYSILRENGFDVDVYIHTWKTDVNKIWDTISPISIDYEEYKLLNPTDYKIDDQNIFLESIQFSDYFYIDIWNTIGHSTDGEWMPELIQNHLCALESQKRVTQMVASSEKKYDYIMYIRPDVEIYSIFPVDCFNMLKKNDCCIVNSEHHEDYNDRFALMHYEDCIKYSHRIDEIIEFRKNNGRIVSEKYTKFILDKYYNNIHQIEFKFAIIRPNLTWIK